MKRNIFSLFWTILTCFCLTGLQQGHAQNRSSEHTSSVRGKVIDASKIPDPENNPYENVLVAHRFRKAKGEAEDSIPETFIVFFWAIQDRKIQKKKGGVIGFYSTILLMTCSAN